MNKKLISLLSSISIFVSVFSGLSISASAANSSDFGTYIDGWYHVSNADQLVALSEATENTGHPALTAKFVLDCDIEIPV